MRGLSLSPLLSFAHYHKEDINRAVFPKIGGGGGGDGDEKGVFRSSFSSGRWQDVVVVRGSKNTDLTFSSLFPSLSYSRSFSYHSPSPRKSRQREKGRERERCR